MFHVVAESDKPIDPLGFYYHFDSYEKALAHAREVNAKTGVGLEVWQVVDGITELVTWVPFTTIA